MIIFTGTVQWRYYFVWFLQKKVKSKVKTNNVTYILNALSDSASSFQKENILNYQNKETIFNLLGSNSMSFV